MNEDAVMSPPFPDALSVPLATATATATAAAATSQVPAAPLVLRRILVPLDFSPPSLKALHYAKAFARQFHARLVLVHVMEPVVFPSELGYAPLATEALERSFEEEAQAKLSAMGAEIGAAGLLVETRLRVGRPFHEIALAAAELDADLIVIATHGFTGLTHVLLGSTAERVVRHAPCPVLVVREQEHEFVSEGTATTGAAPTTG
jgi:nucleotide-binding universal stress UspA family protein